jgi:hypothetical protein
MFSLRRRMMGGDILHLLLVGRHVSFAKQTCVIYTTHEGRKEDVKFTTSSDYLPT